MENQYKVYKYTFPNGIIYIGQTKRPLKIRFLDGYKNKKLMDAIHLYGWENIQKEILSAVCSKEEANEKEISMIAEYDACNPCVGYNISKGGDLGFLGLKHTDESKRKMSLSGKGKHSGTNNWNTGRKRTEEEKEKCRNAKREYMKAVVQKNEHGEAVNVFESLSAAARAMNTSVRNIRMCVSGKSKTAKGFKWELMEKNA